MAAKALIASPISFFLSKRLILRIIFSPLKTTPPSSPASSFSLAWTLTQGYTTTVSTCFFRSGQVLSTTPFVKPEFTATALE
jgi:hypothetical protein